MRHYGYPCFGFEEHPLSNAVVQVGGQVLQGMESGAEKYRGLHILGYYVSPDTPGLRGLCEDLNRRKEERKHPIVEFLRKKEGCISLAQRYHRHVTGGIAALSIRSAPPPAFSAGRTSSR